MATLTAKDFKKLQFSLILLVVFSAIGAALIYASMKQLDQATRTRATAMNAQRDVKGRLAKVNEEEKELREKLDRYNILDRRGVIGQEHRLDWIEQIRRTEKDRKLFKIDYQLEPQQKIDSGIALPAGNGVEVQKSSMKFSMPLLHEDDLLNFLTELSANVQAHLRLNACTLTRVAQTAEHGPAPQLKAECELDWVTLRESK